MGKLIDLTGHSFGKWKVINMISHTKPSGKKETYCLCLCECGTQKSICPSHLTRGKSKQCIKCYRNAPMDLEGRQFNEWEVISYVGKNKHGIHVWNCKCSCGNTFSVAYGNLKSGNSKKCYSCGRKDHGKKMKTHGCSHLPEYRSWRCMLRRCHNPKDFGYSYYGGRGVTVYKEWCDSFESFYDYVGKKPSSTHTIDRIDNERGYEPGNVRWATKKEQIENRKPYAPYSKLNESQVIEIRDLYKSGKYSQSELGKKFLVHRATIGAITSRKNWKHI